MSGNEQVGPNTVERLRELLLQLYVSSPIRDDLSEADAARLLDTMLAAGEGECESAWKIDPHLGEIGVEK